MDDRLLDPSKFYNDQGKEEHRRNVEEHLEALVKKSAVDTEQNRLTMEKLKKKQAELSSLAKALSGFKVLRALLIFGIIVGGAMAAISLLFIEQSTAVSVLVMLCGLGILILSVLLLIKKVNPKIKGTDSTIAQKNAEIKRLEDEGYAQMAGLNSLFTDDDAFRLFEKTLPDFAFEKNFTVEQERLFIEQYDLMDLQNENCSMTATLSGKYNGNPFLYGRRRVHRMGSHVYRGSLHISWSESYRDSQGRIRTRHRSQVLYASVSKPKPFYHTNTFLVYGNQAAPTLSFSRDAEHIEDLSEKAIEKKIKKGEQELQKNAERAAKRGGNFQEMANSEFDVLFGATDRDNEVEFRLMYTPLAQLSTVNLLKDGENYGDDFNFIKRRRCNLIISEHSQTSRLSVFANDYKHFDFEEIKRRFLSYNEEFFKSVYFDFAPLFCVPAYLEQPATSLESPEPYENYFPYYEHEVMANAIGGNLFAGFGLQTEAILKTETLKSENGRDLVSVTAHSYTGEGRVDFIPTLGGDGRMHAVPVHWIEYIPITRTATVVIGKADETISGADAIVGGVYARFA